MHTSSPSIPRLRGELTDALARALGRGLALDHGITHDDLDRIRETIAVALGSLQSLRNEVDDATGVREVGALKGALVTRITDTATSIFTRSVSLERSIHREPDIHAVHWIDAHSEELRGDLGVLVDDLGVRDEVDNLRARRRLNRWRSEGRPPGRQSNRS